MLVAAGIFLVLFAGTAAAQDALVATGGVGLTSDEIRDRDGATASTWTSVFPGGDTGCAFDTEFRFFVHEGPDPSKLLVWFQGGGACWHWVSCSGMFDRTVTDRELDGYAGIFAFDDAENPFADHSVVFIPYCTGDLHAGDASVRYGEESWDTAPVHHRGWTNVGAVLTWMSAHLASPDHLVVAGASAGSYGALFNAPRVAALYPDADVVLIGDSGVPLLNGYPEILERWGAADRLRALWGVSGAGATGGTEDRADPGAPESPITLRAAHEEVARLLPGIRIAQLTSSHDDVQAAFYLISGSAAWREATFALLRELEEALPTFHAFVVDGTAHGLLRDEFFTDREADGVSLHTWISDLLANRPVENRYCAECEAGG